MVTGPELDGVAKVPRTITAANAQKQQLEPIGLSRPTADFSQEHRYKTYVFYCRKWAVMNWDSNENDVEDDFGHTFASIWKVKNEKPQESEDNFSSISGRPQRFAP